MSYNCVLEPTTKNEPTTRINRTQHCATQTQIHFKRVLDDLPASPPSSISGSAKCTRHFGIRESICIMRTPHNSRTPLSIRKRTAKRKYT